MATKKKAVELYDDDDEINKSIREFQQEKTKEAAPEEQPKPVEEEEEEGFGVTFKGNSHVIINPEPENGAVNPATTDDEDRVIMLCSCCDKEWTTKNARLSRPACSCPLFATCKECGYCKAHCRCNAPRTLVL